MARGRPTNEQRAAKLAGIIIGENGERIEPSAINGVSGDSDGINGGTSLDSLGSGDGNIIDPGAIIAPGGVRGSEGTDGTSKPEGKKRGRKPGSTNNAQAKASLSVEGLEFLLFSTHQVLSALTKVEELKLDETEASALAKASYEVAKHYSITNKVSAQGMAWVALVQTAALIYGPRIMAIRLKRAMGKA